MSTELRREIERLKQRFTPANNDYLRALADGSFSREDFIETQIQFLFAVVFFSRPMEVLAGRLPRPEMRLSLLRNVSDEHARIEWFSEKQLASLKHVAGYDYQRFAKLALEARRSA